ncbi:MAG: hypothetical protein Q8Q52_07005 [Acidimicrobiia bacterium]|nr:hypothetical protein [Acidimicrobiia bacterium]
MKPDEAAFESHIAGWLADHGGYTGWKLGTQSADFDATRGLDTAELFAFIEGKPDQWAIRELAIFPAQRGTSLATKKPGVQIPAPPQLISIECQLKAPGRRIVTARTGVRSGPISTILLP